jgi:hypothetical protein
MKEMEERSGELYPASAGSVYPTFQLLEDEGEPGTVPNYKVLLRTLRPRPPGRPPSQAATRFSTMP